MHIKKEYKGKSYVPRIYFWQSIKSWTENFARCQSSSQLWWARCPLHNSSPSFQAVAGHRFCSSLCGGRRLASEASRAGAGEFAALHQRPPQVRLRLAVQPGSHLQPKAGTRCSSQPSGGRSHPGSALWVVSLPQVNSLQQVQQGKSKSHNQTLESKKKKKKKPSKTTNQSKCRAQKL